MFNKSCMTKLVKRFSLKFSGWFKKIIYKYLCKYNMIIKYSIKTKMKYGYEL